MFIVVNINYPHMLNFLNIFWQVKVAYQLACSRCVFLAGLCGNLWNLPFDDSCFSVVCSNLGIDECRFVGKIISEAVRVLKTNGRLVLTCRTSGYLRHKELFDLFGFTCHESESILNRVNLYTNINQLDKIMARLNCTKTAYKDFGVRFVAEYTKMSLAQKQWPQ